MTYLKYASLYVAFSLAWLKSIKVALARTSTPKTLAMAA